MNDYTVEEARHLDLGAEPIYFMGYGEPFSHLRARVLRIEVVHNGLFVLCGSGDLVPRGYLVLQPDDPLYLTRDRFDETRYKLYARAIVYTNHKIAGYRFKVGDRYARFFFEYAFLNHPTIEISTKETLTPDGYQDFINLTHVFNRIVKFAEFKDLSDRYEKGESNNATPSN